MLQTGKNKKILALTGVFLGIAMVALIVLFHTVIHKSQMLKAQEAVYNLLQVQLAIREYVHDTIRPEIYRLQDQGVMQADYFSPELMSRSYISREVLKTFLDLQGKEFSASIFRYASRSPLNLENQATAFEEQLLSKFENDEISEYCEKNVQNGQAALFYAIPLGRFDSSCLLCHSDPAIAPPSLVARYGDSHGFYRQEGQLSGLMSISIPLARFNAQCVKTSTVVAFLTALGFVAVYFMIRALLVKKDGQDLLLEQQNRELDRLSTTDPLTGLWNRLRFNHETPRYIAQAQSRKESLAMAVIDIDHFKKINDTFGHSIGDEVLKRFSAYLQQQCRKADFLARLGGEEFVILTPGMDRTELEQFAQRLLEGMLSVEYPHNLQLTASVGFALYQAGDDQSVFFSRADRAMYQSKQDGRYCYNMAE